MDRTGRGTDCLGMRRDVIPVLLEMRNFLSYGAQAPAIDFTPFRLAAITGPNGAGKSTLFDAWCWALWGRARGVAANGVGTDDLIHRGAEQMEVRFLFEMEGQRYQVIRRREKRRGVTQVEFDIDAGGQWRSLTGESRLATDRRIQEVVHIDYDTFVKSAYMPQGKADAFTLQSPSERKETLAQALGLSRYALLEEAARAQQRTHEAQLGALSTQQHRLEEEQRDYTDAPERVEQARLELQQADLQLKGARQALEHLQQRANDAQRLRKELEQLEQQAREVEEHWAQTQKEQQENADALAALDALEAERDRLRPEMEALAGEEHAFAQLQEKFVQDTRLAEQEAAALQEEALAQQALRNAEKEYARQRESHGTAIAEGKKGASQLREVQKQLQEIEQQLTQAVQSEAQMEKARVALQSIAGQLGGLRKQLEQLRNRYRQIAHASARCPLCGKPLSEQERQQLLATMTQEGRTLQQQCAALEQEERLVQQQIATAQTLLQAKSSLLDKQRQLTRLAGQWEAQLQIAQRAQDALYDLDSSWQAQRTAFEAKLTALHDEVEKVAQARRALGYDKSAYESLRLRLQRRPSLQQKWTELEKAAARRPDLLRERQRLTQMAQHWQEMLQQIDAQRKQREVSLEAQQEVEAQLVHQRDQCQAAENAYKAAESEVVQAEARLARAEAIATQLRDVQEACRKEAEEVRLWRILTEAFGKKGIPALIIENAVPELADEANQVLDQLTDGRIYLQLETQRENRQGKTVETLEIILSDEMGPRRYELYSGGEAFKVNFALRIGLSRLLARRSGARLQCVVMDEGFGTQDEHGKEQVVSVLNAISHEFEKILVITHLSDLNNAFPAQIEVHKEATGSIARVRL